MVHYYYFFISQEVDLAPGLRQTAERSQYMDFAYPVFNDFRFLVQYPEEENRFFNFIRQYQPLVITSMLIRYIQF